GCRAFCLEPVTWLMPGCSWWYRAKARLKNGASNVDPAPVSVSVWPPVAGLAVATSVAEVFGVVAVVVHPARARTMIAAAMDQIARCDTWWADGPGRALRPGMASSSALRSRARTAGYPGPRPGRPSEW